MKQHNEQIQMNTNETALMLLSCNTYIYAPRQHNKKLYTYIV